VPSQTEYLADLGLEENLVGITKFCIHPAHLKECAVRVGGTKDFSIQKIVALKPDLVIGNKEENDQKLIEELEKRNVPVWMSKIETVEDALQMMKGIGELVGRQEQAASIINKVKQSWTDIISLDKSRQVAYLIWKNPWMAAGADTYISNVLKNLGFENVFSNISHNRYPQFDLEILSGLKPEEVFLSSEPYPFKSKHIEEIKYALPEANVRLVDGEMFSWYGSRMIGALDYFRVLLSQIDK
jgi:ABC-type Fe3+-hydroxamate transport system substrate-binding protein